MSNPVKVTCIIRDERGIPHLSRRFMDEEHEREIVEREKRGRLKSALGGQRPDIVHPLDLNTAAVEVVTIRPNAAGARNLINKRSSGSYPFLHAAAEVSECI